MLIVFILLFAINLAIADRFNDGGMGPADFDRFSPDGDDDDRMGMLKEFGVTDPRYLNPVFKSDGQLSERKPDGPGGGPGVMPPGAQMGQFYGRQGLGRSAPDPPGAGPRFDYDIVSEISKSYKNKPFAGGSGHSDVNDMYDFEEKLTMTGKWDEFLELLKERKESGKIPKDWQQDVQYWSAWIRNAMNEKKMSDKKKEEAVLRQRPPSPADASPGMSPYWGDHDEAPKKTENSEAKKGALVTGQKLLDAAIARIKSISDAGGTGIPPQMPEDGTYLGEMQPFHFETPVPEGGGYMKGMPPRNPATLPIGPGLRRPPPNSEWPDKPNLGSGPGNIPPPPNQHGYGDPYQMNPQGFGPGNIPPPDNPGGYGGPYQTNPQGFGPVNIPPPDNPGGYGGPYQANPNDYGPGNIPPPPNPNGYGNPYQGNPQGYGPGYMPPPPNLGGNGNPYQANPYAYGPGNIPPPPNPNGYGNQFAGMQGPPNSGPGFGNMPQQPSIWRDDPSQIPGGAQQANWLRNPSGMPPLNTKKIDEMANELMQRGETVATTPDPNYRNNIFKVYPPQSKQEKEQQDSPPSKMDSNNSPNPKEAFPKWPKAIQLNISPPPANNSITSSKGMPKIQNVKPKEKLISDLPMVDDFKAPVRWVKFNSRDTQDGLARVTDPKTGKNQQVKINGSLYVPVVDHNLARIGVVLTTTPPPKLAARMPAREQAVIKTLMANVDMEKMDERDWLAIESAMGGRYDDDTCDGDSCQSRCHSLGCQTKCSGDTCASGCVADSCTAYCKGPGCLAMCIGQDCNARCDGLACDSRCRGKDCEAKCRSFSCHHTVNGEFKIGGGTWEQNYPQYDTKHAPAYD